MPQYKLAYFNGRGKAEIIRLILSVADVEFEDYRIEITDWPGDLKETLVFGQLPVFWIDGVQYCQTYSIARHLAQKYDLVGKSEQDKFRGDMIVDCVDDTLQTPRNILKAPDADTKAKLQKMFREEEWPTQCGNLEKILKQNKDGDGYCVGDSLTWADLMLFHGLTSYIKMTQLEPPPTLDAYSKLKAFVGRIENHPKVAPYLARRPQTLF